MACTPSHFILITTNMPITSNIDKGKGLEMEAVQSMFPRGLMEAVILYAVA